MALWVQQERAMPTSNAIVLDEETRTIMLEERRALESCNIANALLEAALLGPHCPQLHPHPHHNRYPKPVR